jgi:UDP-N-acetylglucosamine/UDP-N-acetylgalactosamine diphosphorylase
MSPGATGMKSWSIGEVARLLGVKPHVIRYWESELPLLSPRKGLSGRREYSGSEIRLLLRFRHLLYDRKFTIEGAKRRLWEEIGAGDPNVTARFAQIRADLIDALMTVRKMSAGATDKMSPAATDRMSQAATERMSQAATDRMSQAATEGGRDAEPQVDGEDMTETHMREKLVSLGQEHLFAHWGARPEPMKSRLMRDLASLDIALVQELRACLGEGTVGRPALPTVEQLAPAPYIGLQENCADRRAREEGEECIRRGATAFLTVAGGQGSRLGFEGPKGMFPVTPIRRLSLFALFAERLTAARRRYGVQIPWLIMTGPHNHQATIDYFTEKDWFGLGSDTVTMFMQGSVPSFSPEGLLLLGPEGGLFFNPNGHGGVIDGLRKSGILEAMREQGVEHLFYFQVDNPLVRVPDPVFLGFHRRALSQVSSKVVEKAYPEEKLGAIATADGKPMIVEYSDLPPSLMHAQAAGGGLLYPQGSIAIHLFDVAFLAGAGLQLPWHLARKRVRALNPLPGGTEIVERDAVKMEKFVFDTIPLSRCALFFETERAEEFAPLKNREGVDSIETCVRGQVEQAARWLRACGVEVPRDGGGRSRYLLEISPLFALDQEVLAARRGIVKDRIDEDTLLV